MPFVFWSNARPQAIDAGFEVAYMRVTSYMSSTGTSQMAAAFSGDIYLTRSANSSKPYVHFSTKSWSYKSSVIIMLHIAIAKAASVPGRRRICKTERVESQLTRGSMQTSFAPRFIKSITE